MSNFGNLNFTINIGGDVFSGIARIDNMMNSLTADIDRQRPFWKKISLASIEFNNVLKATKTIASGVIRTLDGFEGAYKTQAEAETKLAQVMRNTMDASDAEVESIKRLASEQQALGVIGDEIQLAGAQELGGGVKENYNQCLETERARQAEKSKGKGKDEAATAGTGEMGEDLPSLNPKGGSSSIGDALGGIGGKAGNDNAGKIKNINITIDKVVEHFTVSTTNLREDASKIKQMVADTLIGAVNDLNYATE